MAQQQIQAKSFIGGLLDFSFTSFITLKFLKVIYAIVMVLIGLFALVFFVRLASQGGGQAVLGLILAPVVAFLYLVFARVYLEVIAMLFRIGENTSIIASAVSSGGAPPAFPGSGPPLGYGPPPSGPSAPR